MKKISSVTINFTDVTGALDPENTDAVSALLRWCSELMVKGATVELTLEDKCLPPRILRTQEELDKLKDEMNKNRRILGRDQIR